MANENKMGYLPIKKLILQMSLPPMCSMFLQYSYNLVDSMFVANINENALAAVSLSFPITTLMISLSIWIGVGINVLIAGYLGEKEQDLADCATTLGLLVALIVGICINILALLIMKPYFSAFTNNPAIFDYAMQYMSVCTFMQVPNMVHIAIQKVFQGTGNMITPMWFQIAGVIFNFVFDPLLIFGIGPFPKMGIRGAALATVLGYALSMVIAFLLLVFTKQKVRIKIKGFHVDSHMLKNLFSYGFPSFVMNALGSFMLTFYQSVFNSLFRYCCCLFWRLFQSTTDDLHDSKWLDPRMFACHEIQLQCQTARTFKKKLFILAHRRQLL